MFHSILQTSNKFPTRDWARTDSCLSSQVYLNSATGGFYDGCDDAIIRTSKPNVMLTHDLIEEFLNEFFKNRISMSGWFWAKMAVFKAAAEGLVKWAGDSSLDLLQHCIFSNAFDEFW